MQSETIMRDAATPPAVERRRVALGLLALLLVPALAACKEVHQGDGVATIRRQREQNPTHGR
jgi:hypothetical protein